jgi:hypothetical protein
LPIRPQADAPYCNDYRVTFVGYRLSTLIEVSYWHELPGHDNVAVRQKLGVLSPWQRGVGHARSCCLRRPSAQTRRPAVRDRNARLPAGFSKHAERGLPKIVHCRSRCYRIGDS